MTTLIIVPTYNELDNITKLIPRLLGSTVRPDLLVVDDGSPDGTARAVRDLAAALPAGDAGRLSLLEREGKLGLGSAYIAGFRYAMEKGYDFVFEMDADFSHPPQALPRFMEAIEDHDLVIGSRYVRGGRIEGWGLLRYCISYGGNLLSRLLLHCGVKDLTAGFRCYRVEALRSIDLEGIISEGYFFQVEMTYTFYLAGFRITEIPITFTDRRVGQSKMSGVIFSEALRNLLRLRRTVQR
jgi:dolichol-phosphate mannosyltransferase